MVVHDYSGHPFQIQLSRELAGRGHVVHHQYCPSYVSGHGDMGRRRTDPANLTITEVSLRRPFARYRAWTRVVQEFEYGFKAFLAIRKARPDVAVLCNVPLLANFLLSVLLVVTRQRYVFWHQDVYSAAIRETLNRRLPGVLAKLTAVGVEYLEKWVARHARRIVAITHAFEDLYKKWLLPVGSYTIIPNWAEIDEFTVESPDRRWLVDAPLRAHLLLYSGTLGLKHDPGLLLELACAPELSDCSVAVISEGKGRDWLAERKHTVDEGRLILFDYVPFHELPRILTAADVLISILEPEASRFSVPSKVLTYLCAGRPILAVMDSDNAAAQMLTDHDAGLVVPPPERHTVPYRLRLLLDDDAERKRMGQAARALAERVFDIEKVADQFENVIHASAS